jgi:hypothetical protein
MSHPIILSTNLVLRTDRQSFSGGGGAMMVSPGGSASTRDRTGKAAFAAMMTMTGLPVGYAESTRILTNSELWQAYRLCPDVRSSIETTVRKISTRNWAVKPRLDPSDPQYEMALGVAAQAETFLGSPNKDGETWQVVWSKAIRDLLVYDAFAIEHVFDKRGRLEELVVLHGGNVNPQEDPYQRLMGYCQLTPNGAPIYLEPEQVLYANLFPNTTAPGGTPLIETLITEITSLMRQSNHVMRDFDSDEVPPGVLVLIGIAGEAAKRAAADFQQKKGRDDKLRIITVQDPTSQGARWVQMTPSNKDMDMTEVVKEVRRTVWRLFGVKPVSMGDTEATPRATAEVQAVSEEGSLIEPILELLEGLINTRTMPLVVGEPELAKLVYFSYDWEQKYLPEQELKQAQADASDFDRGTMTVNEVRERRGRAPVENGDVPLVKTGAGYVPLSSVVMGQATPEGVSEPDAGQDAGTAPGETEGDGEPENGAPGTIGNARPKVGQRYRPTPAMHRYKPPRDVPFVLLRSACGCSECEPRVVYAHRSTLPSEWQPDGKFKGYRTLDLSRLGDQLLKYSSEVTPLYRRARMDTVAAVRSYLGDGKIDNQEIIPLTGRIRDILETLHVNWRMVTEDIYRVASKVGRDAAVQFQGAAVAQDWEVRGARYCDKAMGYLVAQGGLVKDLSDSLIQLLVSAVRCRPGSDVTRIRERLTRAWTDGRAVEDDVVALIDGSIDTGALLGSVRHVFDSNQFRIANWQGKLVELSNETLLSGLAEQPSVTDANGNTTPPEEWWYDWCSVGDNARCPTCVTEGTMSFRPVSQMKIQPGGETECRGKCRCVLTFWLASEVKNGTAVSLSNL